MVDRRNFGRDRFVLYSIENVWLFGSKTSERIDKEMIDENKNVVEVLAEEKGLH